MGHSRVFWGYKEATALFASYPPTAMFRGLIELRLELNTYYQRLRVLTGHSLPVAPCAGRAFIISGSLAGRAFIISGSLCWQGIHYQWRRVLAGHSSSVAPCAGRAFIISGSLCWQGIHYQWLLVLAGHSLPVAPWLAGHSLPVAPWLAGHSLPVAPWLAGHSLPVAPWLAGHSLPAAPCAGRAFIITVQDHNYRVSTKQITHFSISNIFVNPGDTAKPTIFQRYFNCLGCSLVPHCLDPNLIQVSPRTTTG